VCVRVCMLFFFFFFLRCIAQIAKTCISDGLKTHGSLNVIQNIFQITFDLMWCTNADTFQPC